MVNKLGFGSTHRCAKEGLVPVAGDFSPASGMMTPHASPAMSPRGTAEDNRVLSSSGVRCRASPPSSSSYVLHSSNSHTFGAGSRNIDGGPSQRKSSTASSPLPSSPDKPRSTPLAFPHIVSNTRSVDGNGDKASKVSNGPPLPSLLERDLAMMMMPSDHEKTHTLNGRGGSRRASYGSAALLSVLGLVLSVALISAKSSSSDGRAKTISSIPIMEECCQG